MSGGRWSQAARRRLARKRIGELLYFRDE